MGYCIAVSCSLTDLLEKSRVTYQLPGVERNYHIFYWLLSGQYPDYAGNTCFSLVATFLGLGCWTFCGAVWNYPSGCSLWKSRKGLHQLIKDELFHREKDRTRGKRHRERRDRVGGGRTRAEKKEVQGESWLGGKRERDKGREM